MKTSIRILSPLALGLLWFCTMGFVNAQEFCWMDSYGRGAGTIPTQCTGGKDNQAGLCYDNCRSGYYGVGPVCWSACPAGYVDHGAICHIDQPLTKDVSWVCTHWFPGWLGGGCRWGESRCPAGYTNVGLFCALDSWGKSPPAPLSGSYLDPMKDTYGRGAGTIPQGCTDGKDNQWGLCYQNCNAGYTGVGPVCWSQPPKGWVQCGMGAAKDAAICGQIVFGQVTSVGNLALNVASLGGSKLAKTAAETSELRKKYNQLKALYQEAKPAIQEIRRLRKQAGAIEEISDLAESDTITPEDMARAAAEIASLLDPTGVASTIASYTYPKCSAYFSGNAGRPSPPPPPAAAAVSGQNVALRKPASQSSTGWGGEASRAVDGNPNGNYNANSVTHTNNGAIEHWQVNLVETYIISEIKIHNRTDCCGERLAGAYVQIFNPHDRLVWTSPRIAQSSTPVVAIPVPDVTGTLVRVVHHNQFLQLAEVEVIGTAAAPPAPARPNHTLQSGGTLKPGEQLVSQNGRYRAVYLTDGNVVVYDGPPENNRWVWQTRTHGQPGTELAMLADGNLVLYRERTALWQTATHGRGAGRLVMQDNGNLVIYYGQGSNPSWSTQGGLVTLPLPLFANLAAYKVCEPEAVQALQPGPFELRDRKHGKALIAGDVANNRMYHQDRQGRANGLFNFRPAGSCTFHILDTKHNLGLVGGEVHDNNVYHQQPSDRPVSLWEIWRVEGEGKQWGYVLVDQKHRQNPVAGENYDGNVYHQQWGGRPVGLWQLFNSAGQRVTLPSPSNLRTE